jgi:hypothetical protein
MGKPGLEELEKAILISNKSHVQRMERIEQNIRQLTETMIQSNQVLGKVYADMEKLNKRVSELEAFAQQIIEANRAANILLKNHGKQDDPELSQVL